MGNFTHVSIDFFPFMVMVVLFFNCKKTITGPLMKDPFGVLAMLTLFGLVVDDIAWCLSGVEGTAAYAFGIFFNMLYFLIDVMLAFYWIRYIWFELHGTDIVRSRKVMIPVGCIASAYLVVLLSSPFTGAIFYLDENNVYIRGHYFIFSFIIIFASMIISMLIPAVHYLSEPSRATKRTCIYLILFNLPFFAGAVVQAIWSIWLLWPGASMSILIAFINIRNRQITSDPLTGLNNRNALSRFLKDRADHYDKQPMVVIMMDIDNFKRINDRYGHTAGDEALWNMADVMRETFGHRPVFLSRYGGDEFVMIKDYSGEADAKETVRQLRDALDKCNKSGRNAIQFGISAGYGVLDGVRNIEFADAVRDADDMMYDDKAQRREEAMPCL